MRGLQTKQSPIVRFVYDQSMPQPLTIKSPAVPNSIKIAKSASPNQSQIVARVISPKKEQIHIKIIDQSDSKMTQAPTKPKRRRKIFQGSQNIQKVSSTQVKASVVVNSAPKIEQIAVKQQPSRVLYAPPVIVSCNHQEEQSKLAKQLLVKRHEIEYLKMQVERFRRCEQLSKQNQNIYKRLVESIPGDADQNILEFSTKTAKPSEDHYQHNRLQKQYANATADHYNYSRYDNTAKLFEFNSSDKDQDYRTRQSQTLPIMAKQHNSPVLQNIFSCETLGSPSNLNQFVSAVDDGTSNAITFNKHFPKQQKKPNTHKKILKNHRVDSVNYLKFQLTDLNRNLQTKYNDYAVSRLIERGSILNSSFRERGRSLWHASRRLYV